MTEILKFSFCIFGGKNKNIENISRSKTIFVFPLIVRIIVYFFINEFCISNLFLN